MSNFNLLSFQRGATLSVSDAFGGTFVDVTEQFADASQLVTHDMVLSVQNIIYYIFDYDFDTKINCVYIERINVDSSLTMRVFDATNPASHVQIANTSQVDDYLYVDISNAAISKYAIEIKTNTNPPSSITMSAPFIGGTDLAGLSDYNYSNRNSYKFADSVTFQRTKTSSYPQSISTLSKNFTIPRVKTAHAQYYYEFLLRNATWLVLFRSHDAEDRHNYTLGYLSPKDAASDDAGTDFPFSIEFKNTGSDRANTLSEFSAPFVPDPFVPTLVKASHIDTNGTHATYGELVGLVNGVNQVFTTSIGSYDAGSVEVIYRGAQQTDFVETNASTGVVTIGFAPKDSTQDNELIIKYEKTT